MKTTRLQMIELFEGINEALETENLPMPLKIVFARNRSRMVAFAEECSSVNKSFQRDVQASLLKFCSRDESGKPIYLDQTTPGGPITKRLAGTQMGECPELDAAMDNLDKSRRSWINETVEIELADCLLADVESCSSLSGATISKIMPIVK